MKKIRSDEEVVIGIEKRSDDEVVTERKKVTNQNSKYEAGARNEIATVKGGIAIKTEIKIVNADEVEEGDVIKTKMERIIKMGNFKFPIKTVLCLLRLLPQVLVAVKLLMILMRVLVLVIERNVTSVKNAVEIRTKKCKMVMMVLKMLPMI